MTKPTLAATCSVLVLSAASTTNRASAFCRMTTQGGAQVGDAGCVEKGEPLVWTYPCLSYAVDVEGSRWFDSYEEVAGVVDRSFNAWQSVVCPDSGEAPNLVFKPLEPSTCRRAEYNDNGGNVNTIAFLDPFQDECADESYPSFAFAVTIVWHNTVTGEILDVDMMINDMEARRGVSAGGPYADCPEEGCDPPGLADLQSIVTHEAGHFIGIGHSPDEKATMFARETRGSVEKRTLATDDIAAVCAIYPPGDLQRETCDATPIGGLQLNCETNEQGELLACPSPSGGGRCSASRTPDDAPWFALLAAFAGLMVLRRRSRRLAAES